MVGCKSSKLVVILLTTYISDAAFYEYTIHYNLSRFLNYFYSNMMISALGRPFKLGMLYDRRSDKLIVGKTLWSPDDLNRVRITVPQPYTSTEVFTENSIEDKTNALKIETSQKLSFLSGLINVEGSAKYLKDTKTSKKQSRVVLNYETTTELQKLKVENLGTGNIEYPEVFDQDIATDVVVGILYGAKAFFVFEKEISKDESLKDVDRNMEVFIKSVSGISVDGSVDVTEEQKENIGNIHCKMYGDIRTSESPKNYEDVVKVYKQFPSLIGQNGENAVPIKVYLCPLSDINSKCERMVREIDVDLIRKTVEIEEHFQSVIADCYDLAREEVCVQFPRLKKQLANFMKTIELYKVCFQKKLLALLPEIRGGEAEDLKLLEVIEEKERSPFSRQAVDCWLSKKKNEVKRLQGVVRMLGDTSVVDSEALDNELYDPANQYIVCLTFKIASEEDEEISKMASYTKCGAVLHFESSMKTTVKVDEKSTYKKVREALRHFTTLKSVNKDNSSVKFLSTDEPLSLDNESNSGAFLVFYEDGEVENKDLRSYPKLTNVQVKVAGSSTIELTWDEKSGNNVQHYQIQYKEESSENSWSTVTIESGGEGQQTFTLTGLQSSTKYIIRVFAVQRIVISEYSDLLSVTTATSTPPGNPQPTEVTFDSTKQHKFLKFDPEKILGLCNLLEPPKNHKPTIYSLPLKKVFNDPELQLSKYEVCLADKKFTSNVSNNVNKVIMMVGSTGSGKTTLVNTMVNYILAVNWEDNFRFKLIHEDSANQGTSDIGDQTCSQTQHVTCYTLHHIKGFKVGNSKLYGMLFSNLFKQHIFLISIHQVVESVVDLLKQEPCSCLIVYIHDAPNTILIKGILRSY